MKDLFTKESLISFAMTALACAVGIVLLAPLVSKVSDKFTKKG